MKMDSTEAIRFIGIHFIDTCKEYLEEDTYDTVKLILENSSKKSLLKKIKKFMKPFEELTTNGKMVTSDDLLALDIFKEDVKLSQVEVDTIVQQATMCYTICKAVSEVDPNTLKQIESVAQTLQLGLQTELEKLPDEERTNMDPSEMFGKLFGALGETSTSNPEDLLKKAMGSLEGSPESGVLTDAMNKILPTVMSALNTDKEVDVTTRKTNLLELYANIDGHTK
jgi:hypothetical protein